MGIHDQNFKNLILDYPREALQFFAGPEAKSIPDDAKITPLREEMLKERLGDRFFELDIPLLVEFPNGEREGIVFCIEENSKADADWRRHAVYALQLSELMNTTRIIPVAIYPFEDSIGAGKFELAGDLGVYLTFNVLATAIGSIKAAEHLESNNRVELICLPLMEYENQDKRKVLWASINGLNRMETRKDKRIKFIRFVFQYSKLDEQELDNMTQEAIQLCSNPEDFMSTLDVLEARGEMKGILTGIAKGSIKTILKLCGNGIISRSQASEQLEKLAAEGEISNDSLRDALAQLP